MLLTRFPATIVLATRNAGKLAELRARLGDLAVELVSAPDAGAAEVEETGDTLEANALLKARALHAHTGLPALADDTGLEVDALAGAPGVRSARYAGAGATDADNRARLLTALADETNRRAHFRTALAYVDGAGEHIFEGVCAGAIAGAERGTAGFGYDSLFVPDEQPPGAGARTTFAEMTAVEKNAISHRGRSVGAFVEWLAASKQ